MQRLRSSRRKQRGDGGRRSRPRRATGVNSGRWRTESRAVVGGPRTAVGIRWGPSWERPGQTGTALGRPWDGPAPAWTSRGRLVEVTPAPRGPTRFAGQARPPGLRPATTPPAAGWCGRCGRCACVVRPPRRFALPGRAGAQPAGGGLSGHGRCPAQSQGARPVVPALR